MSETEWQERTESGYADPGSGQRTAPLFWIIKAVKMVFHRVCFAGWMVPANLSLAILLQ